MNDYECHYCYRIGPTSEHHIIYRSEVKALEHCKHNTCRLCCGCHYKIHHSQGQNIRGKLRLEFLNYLQISFLKDYIEYKDIKEVLNISDKPLRGILKIVKQKNGEYERRSLIFELMGGYLLNSEEI